MSHYFTNQKKKQVYMFPITSYRNSSKAFIENKICNIKSVRFHSDYAFSTTWVSLPPSQTNRLYLWQGNWARRTGLAQDCERLTPMAAWWQSDPPRVSACSFCVSFLKDSWETTEEYKGTGSELRLRRKKEESGQEEKRRNVEEKGDRGKKRQRKLNIE